MYKKLLICGLGGVLAGNFFSMAQDSQTPVPQKAVEGVSITAPPTQSAEPYLAGQPGALQQNVPQKELAEADLGIGLEEIQNEDDTKNPLYGNPYRVIVSRNLFSLKPPISLGNVVTNVVPLALNTNSLKFLGITMIGGVVKSHFMLAKPGQQPPQQYISLSEGQASDGLECLGINPDPVNPTAEMRADGKQIKVSFETHGIATGGALAAAPQQQNQGQQRGPNSRFGRSQQGGFGGFPQPSQQQPQGAQASTGFNLPAVNAAQTANRGMNFQAPPPGTYTGWSPSGAPSSVPNSTGVSGGSSQGMPMTREAAIYQSRRQGSGGPTISPPMPPGM
ncbi:MAG: hypothetical protein EOM12_01485 [Verrucomicrobiae bacterium]|nr:hypothetical protein [Verrucomicrobiae bacterium]